jgi:hypothetical protein
VFAFIVAGVAQRLMGQLSLFHETIVLLLAFISISSAWIGIPASTEEPEERWLGLGLSEHPRLAYLFRLMSWYKDPDKLAEAKQMASLGPDWWSMLMMLPVFHLVARDFHQNVATCFPDAGEPYSSRGNLDWLASRVLVLRWFLLAVLVSIFFLLLYPFAGFLFDSSPWFKERNLHQRAIQLGVLLFFAAWVLQIVAIEGSLKDLPYFHGAEEDEWGFGQVGVFE